MGGGIKGRGQALVLLALAFAGMLALLALAIDGGNAYAQRRRAQNAADAAALSATRRLYEIRRQGGSEADLLLALREAIDAHGAFNVDGQPNRFEAEYMDENGNPIAPVGAGTIPENARGVRATVINRFDAFFAGVFGFDPMEVRALATAVYRLPPACAFALFAENDLQADFGWLGIQAGGVHAGGDLTLGRAGAIQGPCEYGRSADITGVECRDRPTQAPYQPLPALYTVSDFAPGGPLWNAYPGGRYCIRPQDPSQPIVLDAHYEGAAEPSPNQCLTAQRVRLWDGLYYLEGDAQVIRSQRGGQIRAKVTLAAVGSLILSSDSPYDLSPPFNDPQWGAPLLVAGRAITITTPSKHGFTWQGLILANGGAVTLSTGAQARSDRGAIYGRALRLNGGTLDLTFDPTTCPVGIARVELLR
ncbi:pilus assembly protein TadG-related protein [Thermoflexus sp.]|uniref:pilus assembly protein TadG-related protein n=1 Tax=Thermoflexus sp. TaxID=1969742 RepID=UPI0035E44AE3